MTELPSVSGSAEEAAFPATLASLLRAAPPFAGQPGNVWTIPVPGGRHQRACVAAIPIVNAGPWGRDYHTVLERLHAPYAFTVLPDLIGEIVTEVLAPVV